MKSMKIYKDISVQIESDHAEKAVKAISEVSKSGKFFSCSFVKKDGTLREMTCRLGVEKHLKGGIKTLPDKYICVYDMQSQGYRSINPCTVKTVNGKMI